MTHTYLVPCDSYVDPLPNKGYLVLIGNLNCPVLIQSNAFLSITHCMLILDSYVMSMCYYQLYDSLCKGGSDGGAGGAARPHHFFEALFKNHS